MSKKKTESADFIPEVDKKVAKKQAVEVSDKKKPVKQSNKKPNIFVRIGNKCKEVFSELKRVTWPTWNKIVKNTGIVIAIVLVFLVFITLYDFGLSALYKLMIGLR